MLLQIFRDSAAKVEDAVFHKCEVSSFGLQHGLRLLQLVLKAEANQ